MNLMPNKKALFHHILKNWGDIMEILSCDDNGSVLVLFKEFKSQICQNLKEEVIKNKERNRIMKLVHVNYCVTCVTLRYITAFIEDVLPNIVYHRNRMRKFS